jgi:ferredoxin
MRILETASTQVLAKFMFGRSLNRIICTFLALSLAVMSGVASAESHTLSHISGANQPITAGAHHDLVAAHDHEHRAEIDCGFGHCVTCHLFCHASALLTNKSEVARLGLSRQTFADLDVRLAGDLIHRIERPNW